MQDVINVQACICQKVDNSAGCNKPADWICQKVDNSAGCNKPADWQSKENTSA